MFSPPPLAVLIVIFKTCILSNDSTFSGADWEIMEAAHVYHCLLLTGLRIQICFGKLSIGDQSEPGGDVADHSSPSQDL